MSLCVYLHQIKTEKQSYPKGFDSIRFDLSMLLQTCTASMQLLDMQKDLNLFPTVWCWILKTRYYKVFHETLRS